MINWVTSFLQLTALALGMFLFGLGIALSNEEGSNSDGALWVIAGGSIIVAAVMVMLL